MAKPLLQTTGRRKSARARIRIAPGAGKVVVNGKPVEEYWPVPAQANAALEPLRLTNTADVYDVSATVDGGGVSAQADAFRLGVARALAALDADVRPQLKKAGMLNRDAREKERRKYGLRKARKAKQFSKR